ncbi:hypothetical protein [Maribellus sp. YY47]|uniref:hypothetical protein n=1 Tax=Maribellus sp. YY47 TaxID=2929486 RepID=UPI00200087F4|nr:hypothetical protein [Maribellus sp. YY47]MCK3685796.1 hypothetical protein [Maribellus sp. YY47]
MGRIAHKIYLGLLVSVTLLVFFSLAFYGSGYYLTPLHERPVHPRHEWLKPTGLIGHGIGIVGSAFMIIGVFGYMSRKRFRRLSRLGVLRNWLEFHIFLCTLGPILVLFHTSFKFGGLVAVSFWSMVAVVLSGVIGRFIYLQIPRTIEGRELSLNELNTMESELISGLKNKHQIDAHIITSMNAAVAKAGEKEGVNYLVRICRRFVFEQKLVRQFRKELKTKNIKGKHLRSAVRIFKSKIILNRRIAWLSSMQNFLRYWHVAHLPFALVMLVIMIIHVMVAVLFGYKWIF